MLRYFVIFPPIPRNFRVEIYTAKVITLTALTPENRVLPGNEAVAMLVKKIFELYCIRKVHYSIHKSRLLYNLQNHKDPAKTIQLYTFK
jgi:hypothetical protein